MRTSLALLVALSAPALAQQELYLLDPSGGIFRIDDYATAPAPMQVGSLSLISNDVATDIAFDPVSNAFYVCASPSAGISGFMLYRMDAAFAATTPVGSFGLTSYNALDASSDGRLYAMGSGIANIVAIDTQTARQNLLINEIQFPAAGDLAVDVDGSMLFTEQGGQVGRYDPVEGTSELLGMHGFGGFAWGLEVDVDGTVYMITNIGDIYTYDVATMTPTLVGPTGITAFGATFTVPADSGAGDVFAYCTNAGVANSTGQLGRVEIGGSTVAADNALSVSATNLPPGSFGIFLTSRFGGVGGPAFGTPGPSDGTFCTRDSMPGLLNRAGEILRVDATGRMTLAPDLTNLPSAVGLSTVGAGDSLVFQGWFRDAGPEGNNLTNGARVIFR